MSSAEIDVSHAFAADDIASSLHTYWMMQFIDRFQIVNINRLHIGIMSALRGKEPYFRQCLWEEQRRIRAIAQRAVWQCALAK
jgi:hypothetical protein